MILREHALRYDAPVITNVPKLSSSARLVELSISVWTGRKQDKQATADAANANGADKTLLNTTKQLLGDCPELDAVRKFAANVRNFVYSSTTPWGDLGQRFLPMARFPLFHKEITGMETEFVRLVDEFLKVYDFARAKAQAKLGALWNADEYPSAETLRGKFRFTYCYAPVPDAGDARVDVQNEAEAYLHEEYRKHYTQRFEESMRNVWDRVYDQLKHMSERIDYTNDNKKRFNDTLVSNLRDLVGMLPDFNVGNDPRLTRLHAELDAALVGVTPDGLREDQSLRSETKRKVDDILKNMSW